MKKLICLSVFISLAGLLQGWGQKPVADEKVSLFMLSGSFGGHVPGGDMKSRFGESASVGGTLWYKSNKNWLFSVEGNSIFGKKVKEYDLFKNLLTNNDFIIDAEGIQADIAVFQRGFTSHLKFGKLFPVLSPNPNSGFFFTTGIGFLQHKIRIEHHQSEVPALSDDYKKGYDRLTNGFSTTQFLGYMYVSNNGRINFYAGLEFYQAWTKNRRKYNFDQMAFDLEPKFDMLSGIKVGWIFPINRNTKEKHYYY